MSERIPENIPFYIEGFLYSHITQRRALDEELRELKADEPDVIRDALNRAYRMGKLKEIAQWLYWKYPYTNRSELKDALLKFDIQALPMDFLVQGWGVDYLCPRCQKQERRELKSWSDWQSVKKHFKPQPHTPLPYGFECGECCAEQAKEFKARAEQANAEWWARVNALQRMPYADYLRTDHWQTMRKRALRRARTRCELCNTGERLHVHHRTYERRGYEDPGDLIVLCDSCHAKHHDKLPDTPLEQGGEA